MGFWGSSLITSCPSPKNAPKEISGPIKGQSISDSQFEHKGQSGSFFVIKMLPPQTQKSLSSTKWLLITRLNLYDWNFSGPHSCKRATSIKHPQNYAIIAISWPFSAFCSKSRFWDFGFWIYVHHSTHNKWKHRTNCECCPGHSLIVNHNVMIQVLQFVRNS